MAPGSGSGTGAGAGGTYDGPAAWTIRTAVPDDAEALTSLHLDAWDDAYTGLMAPEVLAARREDVPGRVAQWREALERGVDVHGRPRAPVQLAQVVLDDGPALAGFAAAGPARDDPPPAPLELMALYVRAARWGTGIGHALLGAVVGDQPTYLWVLGGNERARRFYERHGFVLDGAEESTEHGPHLRMVRE